MIEKVKYTFKICKDYFIDFFSTVNFNIKHDNLLDAYMLLFGGGVVLCFILIMLGLTITAIITCPCILLFLLIPLLPYVYILLMKRWIKNKKEINK